MSCKSQFRQNETGIHTDLPTYLPSHKRVGGISSFVNNDFFLFLLNRFFDERKRKVSVSYESQTSSSTADILVKRSRSNSPKPRFVDFRAFTKIVENGLSFVA
jgi:hypothetical protein